MNRFLLQMFLYSIFPVMGAATEEVVLPEKAAESPKESMIKQLSLRQEKLCEEAEALLKTETKESVIRLLLRCCKAMDESTELLQQGKTGAETRAAQTEVIELIGRILREKIDNSDEATKSGEAVTAMLRQLFLNQTSGVAAPVQGAGSISNGANPFPSTVDSYEARSESGVREARRVPHSVGLLPEEMPEEFRPLLEAYNKVNPSATKK